MFNPNEHMIQLKGKDYLQVAWRLVWFREDHPDFGINAEALTITEDHAIFKAYITNADGLQISSGHGSESKRDFGDFIEKAETKAVGRALAMLGYGTQFAADELDEGERIVDSPINRGRKISGVPANEPIPKWDVSQAINQFCKRNGIKMETFGSMRNGLIESGIVKDIPSKDLTVDDFDELCLAIQHNFPDVLKK